MAALTHEQKMLDRPAAAWHAMRRHARDFEAWRLKLRSFEVVQALDAARQVRDEVKRLADAGRPTEEVEARLTAALDKLEAARARGDLERIVTAATHDRLINAKSAADYDYADVMRAVRDDRIRRDLHISLLQKSRYMSWGAVVGSVVCAWLALSWSWDHTESLRQTYRSAFIAFQDNQPKTLRQKAKDLVGFGKHYAEEKRQQIEQRLDERRQANQQKEADLLDQIRRQRGEQ